jgi:hypothetical protein
MRKEIARGAERTVPDRFDEELDPDDQAHVNLTVYVELPAEK